MANVTVFGADWCPDCRRSKRFLSEQRVPYDWVDLDRDAEAKAQVERLNGPLRPSRPQGSLTLSSSALILRTILQVLLTILPAMLPALLTILVVFLEILVVLPGIVPPILAIFPAFLPPLPASEDRHAHTPSWPWWP